jgi:aryl-alcohol dehydrogenase-like predicted oxidoreductase
MEQRPFGQSGIQVPAIGMGTWRTFDVRGARPEAKSHAIVRRAIELGANLFDSSPMYGEAERVLGDAVCELRDRALIATKIWATTLDEGYQQVTRALKYFGGRIDLYQIHNLVNWPQHLDLLERLRDEGKVTLIGATHYNRAAFGQLQTVMKTRRIHAIQIPYNPIERTVEETILPLAADLGLGVVVMRPFGEGTLVRRSPAAKELAPLASFGVNTWPQALLKWVLSDRRCHVAIPATSNEQHMRDNAIAGQPPWFGPEERDYVTRLVTNTNSIL